MSRTTPASAVLAGALLLHSTAAAGAPPVPVSPGSAAGAPAAEACPTFTWTRPTGTGEIELVVFPVAPDGELDASPVLSVRLPAGAQGWTPPADRCLETGGRYAWSLRELGEREAGPWSEAAIFELAAPSRAAVAEALATLRRFLDDGGQADEEALGGEDRGARTAAGEHPADGVAAPRLPPIPRDAPPAGLADKSLNSPAISAVERSTSGSSVGVYGQSNSTLGTGIYGWATARSGSAFGVRGVSSSPGGSGVFGENASYTGSATGVTGKTFSPDGVGVHGVGVAPEGASTGVLGESYSPDGTGVLGRVVLSSGFSYGVFGFNPSTQGYGVAGVASATSGLNYGVYGSTGSAGGYAGFFAGRVNVTGTLTKGSGSFKIDHPLDPANRYLSHSFVESPDMMNVYNGNVALDPEGAAWVELPEWFEALNRDFRYQLTALDRAAPGLHVARRIAGNRFRIAGGTPGTEVSWQVTGIRRDAFAVANPIPVEEDKGELRGRYLHPEAHGQPAALAIGLAPSPQTMPRRTARRTASATLWTWSLR